MEAIISFEKSVTIENWQGVISQKTWIFFSTPARTSNLTSQCTASMYTVGNWYRCYNILVCNWAIRMLRLGVSLIIFFLALFVSWAVLDTCSKIYLDLHIADKGVRGSAVGWGTALQAGRWRVRFTMVSVESFIDIILPAALWPWGWLNL
jgi:hypothetical protein